jgi:hypothetical protein
VASSFLSPAEGLRDFQSELDRVDEVWRAERGGDGLRKRRHYRGLQNRSQQVNLTEAEARSDIAYGRTENIEFVPTGRELLMNYRLLTPSHSLAIHLLRGIVGAVSLGFAFHYLPTHFAAGLVLAVVALAAFRGCPTCWLGVLDALVRCRCGISGLRASSRLRRVDY